MQNGLFNCEWLKDNKAVKNDGEAQTGKLILALYDKDGRLYNQHFSRSVEA